MEEELTTVDTILDFIKDRIEKKIPVSPSLYVDAAAKLNVLLSDEHATLFDWQKKIAEMKVAHIDQEMTNAEAETRVKASEDYRQYCLQKAKIERIEEFIRISKLQARLKDNEYRNG